MRDENQLDDLSNEFYSIIPYFRNKILIKNKRNLSEKFQLCQLLRDILNVNESSNWNLKASIKSKYTALGAYIQPLNKESTEYLDIQNDVANNETKVVNIYEILRPNEHLNFISGLKNHKRLYHGSKIYNYLGILSRGLLLPKYITNDLGDEARSDVGLLGQGLYFSDSSNLSIKYTSPSKQTNSRLLAVCDVSLGECKDYYDFDPSLVKAPNGFHSVRGVKSSMETNSKFEENEYVVYDTRQYKLRYLVELECAPFSEKEKFYSPLNETDVKMQSFDG